MICQGRRGCRGGGAPSRRKRLRLVHITRSASDGALPDFVEGGRKPSWRTAFTECNLALWQHRLSII
jgi:hypothetical protein